MQKNPQKMKKNKKTKAKTKKTNIKDNGLSKRTDKSDTSMCSLEAYNNTLAVFEKSKSHQIVIGILHNMTYHRM